MVASLSAYNERSDKLEIKLLQKLPLRHSYGLTWSQCSKSLLISRADSGREDDRNRSCAIE